MTNDSTNYTHGGEMHHKDTPRETSINFIKQFARVYSATQGIEFTYCILN